MSIGYKKGINTKRTVIDNITFRLLYEGDDKKKHTSSFQKKEKRKEKINKE